jgi:hypothetical protein
MLDQEFEQQAGSAWNEGGTTVKEYEVTCTNKPDRMSAHEHITHIGNEVIGWRMTREEAIRRIDTKAEAFFTVDRATGKRSYVRVVRGDGDKAPYLRTHADGTWNDSLLTLPECDGLCELVSGASGYRSHRAKTSDP